MGKGGQIEAAKGGYIPCTSCCCFNTYIACSAQYGEGDNCASGMTQTCCLANDFACICEDPRIPYACSICPGLYIYPTLACFPTAGGMYPDTEARRAANPPVKIVTGQKKNWLMCYSCCIWFLFPIVHENCYCIPPKTICTCESKSCCICACDAAVPCSPDVPCMVTLLPGCVICSPSPTLKCCKNLKSIKGDGVASTAPVAPAGAPIAVELPEAAGGPVAADAVAVRPLKKWVPEHLRPREAAPAAEVLER